MFVLNALRFALLSLLLCLEACDEDAGYAYVVGLLPDPIYERVMFIIVMASGYFWGFSKKNA